VSSKGAGIILRSAFFKWLSIFNAKEITEGRSQKVCFFQEKKKGPMGGWGLEKGVLEKRVDVVRNLSEGL